jgi:hypothetical protein
MVRPIVYDQPVDGDLGPVEPAALDERIEHRLLVAAVVDAGSNVLIR